MLAKPRFVIDASVAIKWLHEEEKTGDALKILNEINTGSIIALVPDLVFYEVANVLIRGIQKTLSEANEGLDLLTSLPWQVILPIPSLLKDAMELATTHAKLSLYDAIYVAIAQEYKAVVITDDRKLHQVFGVPLTKLL